MGYEAYRDFLKRLGYVILVCVAFHFKLDNFAFMIAFIFVISVLNEKGICVRGAIAKRNVVIRWAAVYALIMFIIIFGAYGKGYVAVDPIYANF